MTRFLLVFLILFAFTPAFSQDVTVRGVIVDAETGDPVPFAHIGVCGKALGTVANENGVYRFTVPGYALQDTLCASAIGYTKYKKAIKDVAGEKLDIHLEPETSVLDEVLIKDAKVTARRVIRKAVNKIRKNYPRDPFQLKGYYRDYLKNGPDYISFLEAAVVIEDPGFDKDDDKSVIGINQMRYSDNYVKYFKEYVREFDKDTTKILIHGISPVFRGNELSNMRFHNPIRNYMESVPFIGDFITFYEKNYDFTIAYYTYVDGEEVYVIDIKPRAEYRFHHVKVEGKLFIRVKDYAILKFNYAYFVTKRLDTRKWYELNLEYKSFEDEMYLKYISYMNYYKIFTMGEIVDMFQYREFFVNDIETGDLEPIPQESRIDPLKPLYVQEVPNDPDFWRSYNRTMLEQPLKE